MRPPALSVCACRCRTRCPTTAWTEPPARPAAGSTSRPKVRRHSRGQHPCLYESRERRGHHQHRWRVVLALTDGQRHPGTRDRTGPGSPARGPDGRPGPAARIRADPATFARNNDAEPDRPPLRASRPASSASHQQLPEPSGSKHHQNSTLRPPADTSAPGPTPAPAPPFRGKPPRSCRSHASSACPSKTGGVSPPNHPN